MHSYLEQTFMKHHEYCIPLVWELRVEREVCGLAALPPSRTGWLEPVSHHPFAMWSPSEHIMSIQPSWRHLYALWTLTWPPEWSAGARDQVEEAMSLAVPIDVSHPSHRASTGTLAKAVAYFCCMHCICGFFPLSFPYLRTIISSSQSSFTWTTGRLET